MIPRTAQMAKVVENILSTSEIDDYGNIILNGYATTGPNTNNIKAWQYQETTTAPVNLPSVTSFRPALRGWTTNYMSYFTRAEAGYSLYPGQENPFLFDVWNFYQNPGAVGATGPLLTVGGGLGGNSMIPGKYLLSATGTSGGYGAVLNVTVALATPGDPTTGEITQISVLSGGSGYIVGDDLTFTEIPGIYGVAIPNPKATVDAIGSDEVIPAAGYSQCPRRFYQNQVSATTPPQYVNNSQAIAYSFMYPVQTQQTPPPIDYVTP